MAYIGRDVDKISNVEVLDNITFDGSSSYTLQKNSVNFTPSSANTLLVSIDGVVQAGNFTVSGSTIDFGTAVAGTSTCDFILHYGTGLITTPADGTVTTAKIGSNAVTSAKLGSDAVTTAKIADANVTSAKMFSTFKNGITMADSWRITASTNQGTNAVVATNWERNDTAGFSQIGTGLTQSSGVFSFPQTGIYLILNQFEFSIDATEAAAFVFFQTTLDNSSYTDATIMRTGDLGNGSGITQSNNVIFDVTDISNCKFRFKTDNFQANTLLVGSSVYQRTGFSIFRLGDT